LVMRLLPTPGWGSFLYARGRDSSKSKQERMTTASGNRGCLRPRIAAVAAFRAVWIFRNARQAAERSRVWPAFCSAASLTRPRPHPLKSTVLEFYGHSPAAYQNNIIVYHTNPADAGASDVDKKLLPHEVKVADSVNDFNTYGHGYQGMDHLLLNRMKCSASRPRRNIRPLHVLLNLGARIRLAD